MADERLPQAIDIYDLASAIAADVMGNDHLRRLLDEQQCDEVHGWVQEVAHRHISRRTAPAEPVEESALPAFVSLPAETVIPGGGTLSDLTHAMEVRGMAISPTDEMVERLRTKASMIMLGEPIAWGSDSAVMDEAASLISALEAERDALRAQVALANDPAYLATAIDKVGMVDKEWKARAEAAEALTATLQKAAEERDEWLRFIARWAWDKTGPADERLSVIQYFPPVKAARPESLSTLRETTDDQT